MGFTAGGGGNKFAGCRVNASGSAFSVRHCDPYISKGKQRQNLLRFCLFPVFDSF
jgi:hypothetical protein